MKKILKKIRHLCVGALIFISLNAQAQPVPIVSTLAGGGGQSYPAQGLLAQFTSPYGLATDDQGNVFISQLGGDFIVKITAEGYATLYAGTSPGATDNGLGTAAGFTDPHGLCSDASGNIWVADAQNNIRKIVPAGSPVGSQGLVSTPDFILGSGLSTGYREPTGICFGDFGYLYQVNSTVSGIASSHNVLKCIPGNDPNYPYGPIFTKYVFAGPASPNSSGNFPSGWVDSPSQVLFNNPRDICSFGSDFYVVDQSNHVIRKITSSGSVSTYAGTGSSGYSNEYRTSATFNNPRGICVDGAGNLYVTDNNSIRKIDATTGLVTTFAGSSVGTANYVNGIPTDARFNNPTGIKVNAAGNLFYIADLTNNVVRKIAIPTINYTNGMVDFKACPGTPSEVQSFTISAEHLASQYNLSANNTNLPACSLDLCKLNVEATTGYEVSASDGGPFTSSIVIEPGTLGEVSSRQVFVRLSENATGPNVPGTITLKSTYAETKTFSVTGTMAAACPLIVTEALHVTTYSGNGVQGADYTPANYTFPHGVFVDASGVYTADTYGNKIRQNTFGSLIAGSGERVKTDGYYNNASFNVPRDVCRDASGNIYVAEHGSHTIRKINSLNVYTLAGTGTAGAVNGSTGSSSSFNYPSGICVDNTGSFVYVADTENNLIRKCSTGTGETESIAGTFNKPMDVAIDASGNLYVADNGSNTVKEISTLGVVTTVAGSGAQGYADGTGTGAVFSNLTGIVTDGTNLYVSDGDRIRKIVISSRVVTTYAGNGSFDFADGPVASASFREAFGLGLDASGNVYVADVKNHRIRKIQRQATDGTYTFAACANAPSEVQTFYISATNLVDDIIVNAPAGFQISTPTSGFASTLPITNVSGSVSATLYVKLEAAAGSYSGNITFTSTNAVVKTIAVSGVSGNPVFSVIKTADDGNVMFPKITSASFAVLSAKGAGKNTYTWSPMTNLSNINNNQTMSFSTGTPGSYNYTVTATGPGGCTSTQNVNVAYRVPGTDYDNPVNVGFMDQVYTQNYSDVTRNNNSGTYEDDDGESSEDIFYKFNLTQTSNVVISNCNLTGRSPYIADSYIYLFDAYGSIIEKVDNVTSGGCSGNSNLGYINRNLVPGTYFVMSEGKGSSGGNITTNIQVSECADNPGMNFNNPIVISDNVSCGFNYTVTEHLGRCFLNMNDSDHSDVFYKLTFTSPLPSQITFSTCNSGVADTRLEFYDAGFNLVAQADNNISLCGNADQAVLQVNSTLFGAGVYYLMVEHVSGNGTKYTLNVSSPPCRASFDQPNEDQSELKVYPNPSSGLFNVELASEPTGELVVTDLLGRQIYRRKLDGSQQYQLDLNGASEGIYIVKVPGSEYTKLINLAY